MTLNEYQKQASKTAVYPELYAFPYLATGLASEAGEVAGLISKGIRGDNGGAVPNYEPVHYELVKELGDVLWFVAQMATELEVDLEFIAETNVRKLASRVERGKIQGSGDDR